MSLLAAIGAGSKVFSGLRKRKAGKEMSAMAKQQEMMAQENAALERRELTESVRRQEFKNEQISGDALASASASGVTIEGTTKSYLDLMESEQQTQMNWMQEAGESSIQQNLKANLLQAQSTKLDAKAMKTGFLTDIAGAVGIASSGGLFGSKPTYSSSFTGKDVNTSLTKYETKNLYN